MRLIDLDKICGIDCDNCRNIFLCNFCDAPVVEQSEDCVSRETVIEWLKDKDIIKTKNQEENARRELAELSSVTPQRPKGKWIRSWCEWQQYLECSKCGYETGLRCDTNYCPNCGAKMEVII